MKNKPLYDIKILAGKWADGTITEHEKQYFEQWYNNFDFTRLEISGDSNQDPEAVKNRILQNLITELDNNAPDVYQYKKHKTLRWVKAVAAAAILILTFGGLYFAINHNNTPLLTQVKVKEKIKPGTNKAILTLADGSRIVLDNTETGILVNNGNALVNNTKGGKVVYDLKNLKLPDSKTTIVYNTITTPRGGQYQIILEDGTKVWLNASSSLRFPSAFTGSSRNVEITGEAYFEVAKNKARPFFVKAAGQTVEVLGTHFNINSYDDEPAVKTTLLEGSVKVITRSDHTIIVPGQQSIAATSTGLLSTQKVNVNTVISWKNGYFMFEDEGIESIMRKISRWYDVDILYQKGYTRQDYVGSISRFADISKVLKRLELTGTVHFNVEGRRITVMP